MPPAIPRGLLTGDVVDLVTRSTDLVVSASSAAAADTFITGNAVRYDGTTRIRIEFFCPMMNSDGSNEIIVNLWEDSTDLGRLVNHDFPGHVQAVILRTPSSGSHTYTIKGWRGSGSGRQFSCGASSASGPMVDAFLLITRL